MMFLLLFTLMVSFKSGLPTSGRTNLEEPLISLLELMVPLRSLEPTESIIPGAMPKRAGRLELEEILKILPSLLKAELISLKSLQMLSTELTVLTGRDYLVQLPKFQLVPKDLCSFWAPTESEEVKPSTNTSTKGTNGTKFQAIMVPLESLLTRMVTPTSLMRAIISGSGLARDLSNSLELLLMLLLVLTTRFGLLVSKKTVPVVTLSRS
mmetsp:Transcript_16459/g.14155  ORF Transcript_16459/g.14155 Transcript_16459/m.14155 type:complete len:210 (+) Transcript_16459:6286-6915(+)